MGNLGFHSVNLVETLGKLLEMSRFHHVSTWFPQCKLIETTMETTWKFQDSYRFPPGFHSGNFTEPPSFHTGGNTLRSGFRRFPQLETRGIPRFPQVSRWFPQWKPRFPLWKLGGNSWKPGVSRGFQLRKPPESGA